MEDGSPEGEAGRVDKGMIKGKENKIREGIIVTQ